MNMVVGVKPERLAINRQVVDSLHQPFRVTLWNALRPHLADYLGAQAANLT